MTQSDLDGAWFERALLPHLDAAFNLARWLVRNRQDAEDVAQEAFLRAVKFREGYLGGNAKAWLLKIVRNTSYSLLDRRPGPDTTEQFDETVHGTKQDRPTVEASLIQEAEARAVRAAVGRLSEAYREVLVLREFEGLSYKEIAEIIDIPIGTVMSMLSRARSQLRELILREQNRGVAGGL